MARIKSTPVKDRSKVYILPPGLGEVTPFDGPIRCPGLTHRFYIICNASKIIRFDLEDSDFPCQEEFFYQRPEIRIPLPDQLKSILVDDWENVTRSMQLVHLPSRNPANTIIDTYWEEEKTKRRGGSPEFDLLAETMQGLKEYFDIALGKVLLYRLERPQYKEVYEQLENPAGTEYDGKKIGDIYGGEHLLRLLGKYFPISLRSF